MRRSQNGSTCRGNERKRLVCTLDIAHRQQQLRVVGQGT